MQPLEDLRQPLLADNPGEWADVPEPLRRFLIPRNGVYSVAQAEALATIARARWFFLRNRGPEGYAFRCKRCGRIHDYFTLHCVERPFNGLTQTLALLVERVGELPDGGPQREDYCGVALGAIVPITRDRARANFARLVQLGYPPHELLGLGAAPYSAADMALMRGL